MVPVAVIRPEPGCSATVRAARELGMEAGAYPLFEVVPRNWNLPPASEIDALLIGSANAVRHGGAQLAKLRDLPAHVVGEATARCAREAGLNVATVGSGGLQPVLDAIPAGARVLRLAGEERVPLRAPSGVTLCERVVYASEPLAMPDALASLLRHQAVVLLHSGEAARHFAAECDRLAIPRNNIRIVALAPRIGTCAGSGWASIEIAPQPTDTALLALAARVCH